MTVNAVNQKTISTATTNNTFLAVKTMMSPISLDFGNASENITKENDIQMAKSQLLELIKQIRNLKENTSKDTKKIIDEKIKNLKEYAEMAGIDLGSILETLIGTMNEKDQKKVIKALGITPSEKTEETSNKNEFSFKNMFAQYTSKFAAATDNTSIERKYTKPSNKGLDMNFLNKVKEVSANINCDYQDLLALMNHESGLNSKVVNPHGGATGLIQFMPSTAKGLGTSTEALRNMSAIEQLDYVEEYFRRGRQSAGFSSDYKLTLGDMGAMGFLPARVTREELCTKDENNNYYSWNPGLDLNKDGVITKTELAAGLSKTFVDESIFKKA